MVLTAHTRHNARGLADLALAYLASSTHKVSLTYLALDLCSGLSGLLQAPGTGCPGTGCPSHEPARSSLCFWPIWPPGLAVLARCTCPVCLTKARAALSSCDRPGPRATHAYALWMRAISRAGARRYVVHMPCCLAHGHTTRAGGSSSTCDCRSHRLPRTEDVQPRRLAHARLGHPPGRCNSCT